MRLNNEIYVEGYKPQRWQKEVHKGVKESSAMNHLIICSRQIGKSTLGVNCMYDFALNDAGSSTCFVSPTWSQSKHQMRNFLKPLENAKNILKNVNSSADMSVEFINGSTVYFKTEGNRESLRGYTFDYLVLDECRDFHPSSWEEVLQPLIIVKGKKVLFLTTPNGKNWIHRLYQYGLNKDNKDWKSYRFDYTNGEVVNLELIKEIKKKITKNAWEQEYMANFISKDGDVFENLERIAVLPKGEYGYNSADTYTAGVDFGRMDDYTALVILRNRKGIKQVIYANRWRNTTWSSILSSIKIAVNKYKISKVNVEINNVGDVLNENLKGMGVKTTPISTTKVTKPEMIENLIVMVEQGELEIPTMDAHPDLYNEMQAFTASFTPSTRTVRYHAPPGLHDDYVMALAVANAKVAAPKVSW